MANFSFSSRALLAFGVWVLLALSYVPAASADTVDFGQHMLGSEGTGVTIVLENDGSEDIPLGQASIRGLDADVFTIEFDGCSSDWLPVGLQCEIDVRFRPIRTHKPGRGSMSAVLFVPDSATGTAAFEAPLIGRVLLPAALRPTLRGVTLPSLQVGQVGLSYRYGFHNPGDLNAQVGQLSLSGPGASQFRLVGDGCSSAAVAPGGTCFFDVTYSPTQPGQHTASVVASGWDPATSSMSLVASAKYAPVARDLRLIAWNAGLEVAGRRLGRRLSSRSIFHGNIVWPATGTVDASLSVRVRGRTRVMAVGTLPTQVDVAADLRLQRRRGAGKLLRQARRSAVAVLRLELTEPSGRRSVGVRRLRVRGGELRRDGSRPSRPAGG